MTTPQIERSEYGAGNGSHNPSTPSSSIAAERQRLNANDPEGIAEDLRLHGQCDKAMPIFRRLADRGTEYAVSQFNLGLCLFDVAKTEHDPQQVAASNKEGAEWVLQAANAGFGKAQAMAIVLYLDGLGVEADPVEAGKWAYIFHDNGSRLVLGLPDISSDTRGRLDAVLTGDKRKAAHARANSWVQTGERADQ
jgi:TPR repeat protein